MGLFSKQPKSRPRQRASSSGVPSSNQALYTYRQNRSVREQPLGRKPEKDQPAKRQKPKVVQHIPALLLMIVIVLSLGYISTLETNPKVVLVENNQKSDAMGLRDPSVYQEAAEDYLRDSVLNRSKFLVDTGGLSRELKSEFSEIATVTVTLPIMGRRPVIEIQTTKPSFILVSGTTSMLVGNNGIALVNVRDVKDMSTLTIPTIQDQSGVQLEAGKPALPQEQAQFISIVREQLEGQGLSIDNLTIPQSPYDLHVRVQGTSYYIKFNILEDPLQQTGSYMALRAKLEAEKVTPAEYVDVRVGERAFYR